MSDLQASDAPTPRGFDPNRAGRWIRKLALPIGVVALVVFFWNYRTMLVPNGMDTFPVRCGPGSVCFVQKRPSKVLPGSMVFVEVGGGRALLEVSEVLQEGRFRTRVENLGSRFASLAQQEFHLDQVYGLVLGAFAAGSE